MRYEVRFTKQFRKDIRLAQKQGRDMDKLFAVADILASGEALAPKYRDHDLSGEYRGCRSGHIEPDWLLIYEIDNGLLVLVLNRVGSHSELFR